MSGFDRSDASAKRASYAYACALLTVLWLFLPYGGYERMMEGKYVCFLVLTLGYAAAMAVSAPRKRAPVTPMLCCAAAYLAFSALSALCSPYGAATLLGGTRRDGLLTLALYVVSFCFLAHWLRPDRLLLYLTALSAALCDLLVLAQLAGRNPLGLYPAGLNYYDGDAAYAGFYAGTSGNADFTAFLLALAAYVLLFAAARLRSWALTPPAVLTLWVLYRLGIAEAWAGLAFAAVWGLALLFPRRRWAMLLVSVLLSIAAFLFVRRYTGGNQTLAEASALLRGDFDGAFGSGRLSIWRDCLYLVRERPLLGGGPDTLWLRGLEPFSWYRGETVTPVDITAAHNEYLNILVNQGAPALAAYLALPGIALVRCFRRAEEPRFALCGAGLLCYGAMACFSISTCITAPCVWLLLAIACAQEGATAQTGA